MNIKEIWKKIENLETINWHNSSYQVRQQPINENSEYQKNHFSYKNGNILVIVHEGGHQALIGKSELEDLY